MARHKTKKQKKLASARGPEIRLDFAQSGTTQAKSDLGFKTTFFSQSEVKLLYKDLLKTLIVTIIVFAVLLFILANVR